MRKTEKFKKLKSEAENFSKIIIIDKVFNNGPRVVLIKPSRTFDKLYHGKVSPYTLYP